VLDLWNLSILNGHALFKYILDRWRCKKS
jgi:hypothetical protein